MRNIRIIAIYPMTETMSEVVYKDMIDGKLKTMLKAASEVRLGETVLDESSLTVPVKVA